MIPSALSGHRISRVLPIHRLHDHKVLPIRDNQEAINTVLPISMVKVSQVSTRLDSKVNIHPLVDQCIPRTDHRNPVKEGQHLRHRVPLHRQAPIRTEGMAAVRILRHHSSDRTVSNRHRAVPLRRRHPRPVHRVLPINSHRLAVLPGNNLHRPKDRDIQQALSNRHNRTTTGQISLISQGGIQTLKRTNNRIHRTNSDRRCIPVVGRVASTVANILPRVPNSSGELTTDPDPVAHPEPLAVHQEHLEHLQRRTNGMRNRIDIRRISSRPTRPINRPSNNRGTKCHPHPKAPRCDHRNEVANHSRRCSKREYPIVCHRRHSPKLLPALHQVQLRLLPARRLPAVLHRLPRELLPNLLSVQLLNQCPRRHSLRPLPWPRSGTSCSLRTASNPRRRCCTNANESASWTSV